MPSGTRTLAPAVLMTFAIALGACRDELPERSTEHPAADTSAARADRPLAPPAVTGTGAPATFPLPVRTAAIDATVDALLVSVSAGNERDFDQLLSVRSRRFIRDIDAARDVFGAAREALGSMRTVETTVLGGDPDSVALLLRGQSTVPGDADDRELIVILLKESGEWKLMYPGLLRPNAHLAK